MKRISCLLLSLLLALLCACGDTNANTPAPSQQTEPDRGEGPAAVPAVCALYYDYAELEVIAPTDSKLPLAAGASHGAPDYLPLWHNGEYGQLAASGGEGYTVPELTDGRASEEGAYGRFCWNGELYHCIHIKADSSYVPSLCSTSGGILWLDLSGDCWADTGWDEIGHFGGFDTVVITGSGTLTLSQRLEAGTGKEKLPALIVDGVDVICPEITLTANAAAEDTANLILLSGSLAADRAAVAGDVCVTGGTASVGLLLDCPQLVCRGGEFILREGWGFVDASTDAIPTVLLTGGTLTADVWMPENIVYQLWAGTITAPGIRYWPETHVLSDTVTIVDPLDAEAADE